MVKYSEQEILRAYDEFNSDKDWVSADSHEIVAYDFLSRNQTLPEFFKERDIFPIYLYCCLDKISHADTYEQRKSLIETYCNENQIFFSQYQSLELVYRLKSTLYSPINLDAQVEYEDVITDIYDSEECIKVLPLLAHKLRCSVATNARFGIMEYYAYFDVDLLKLKRYIDSLEYLEPEYYIVRLFIESLEMSHALDKVDYEEVLAEDKPKSTINGLYYNGDVFKDSISRLLLHQYPVLTGTLNYVYELREKNELDSLSKQKIKSKFERKL